MRKKQCDEKEKYNKGEKVEDERTRGRKGRLSFEGRRV